MRKKLGFILLLIVTFFQSISKPYKVSTTDGMELAIWMAESQMQHSPEPWNADSKPTWNYKNGLVAFSMIELWEKTKNDKYFNYAREYADKFIDENGNIDGYQIKVYNLDNINSGKFIFDLCKKTGNEKYKLAILNLREQLKSQPCTSEGGFWHKRVYTNQMWLDGLYMAAPFYAQYAKEFEQQELFNDVINQFLIIDKHTYDPKTSLNYHGWDESKKQEWADSITGCSRNFWGRGMGWYAMALVDVLDFIPQNHPERSKVINILKQVAEGIKNCQDSKTGLWYQVLDQGQREGNYLEASASSMFVYSLFKATRLNYIGKEYRDVALKGYYGMKSHFIRLNGDGTISLTSICKGAGLGGSNQRDGTFEYYLSEPVVDDDPKGVGPFILACIEMALQHPAKKSVGLDNYYNYEISKKTNDVYHYTWEDKNNSGFSRLGEVFVEMGARIETIPLRPDEDILADLDIYIIVDPDTTSENPNPNYISEDDIRMISTWVKKGGVLLLMGNDGPNCEFTHFNKLAETFGFHFNPVTINPVVDKKWEMGAETNLPNHPVFKGINKVYMKEVSSISLSKKAKAVLVDGNDVLIAETKFGKGFVLAVGDPWLYNEYIDHNRLPADFENLQAAKNLSQYLLKQ